MLPRIQKHINDQVTGCLQTSDGFGIPLQVYLMEGNLVAAHAGDDGRSLLRSLEQRGWLTHTKSEGLKTHLATTSESIYTAVLGLHDETQIREVFYERFRENLCRALASDGPMNLECTESVMVPNVQLAHNSSALLEDCFAIVERTERLRNANDSGVYHLGSRPPLSDAERKITALFPEPLPLEEALRQSPFESFQTWDLLMDLIDRSVLVSLKDSQIMTDPEPQATSIPQSGPPRLTRNDAEEKISAGNRVTRAFYKASDHASGAGAGRAQLRLLLDGSPSQYAMLFSGLSIEEDGSLHLTELIQRLRSRVGPERRSLLNSGLRDLIQRTLSMADESLDDTQMNVLLQETSGYEADMGW